MAEFKFACLHCGQKIQVDELWSGHELQCPSCHKNLTVPPNPAAAPAPRVPLTGEFAARNPPPGATMAPSRLTSTASRPAASAPPPRSATPATAQRRPKPPAKR